MSINIYTMLRVTMLRVTDQVFYCTDTLSTTHVFIILDLYDFKLKVLTDPAASRPHCYFDYVEPVVNYG